jgi:hypothetical protein
MERTPDSGEACDPVSMTTIVATSLRRMLSNDKGRRHAAGTPLILVGQFVIVTFKRICSEGSAVIVPETRLLPLPSTRFAIPYSKSPSVWTRLPTASLNRQQKCSGMRRSLSCTSKLSKFRREIFCVDLDNTLFNPDAGSSRFLRNVKYQTTVLHPRRQ